MKQTLILLVGAAVLWAWAATVSAQSPVDAQYLAPREAQRLNPQAIDLYNKAVKALDRVDAVTAIQLFDQASQADASAIELAFLTSRLAYLRGRMVHGLDAAKYYDISEKALQRIGKQKDLPPLIKRRYEVQLKTIQDDKSKLEVRDSRRKAIGESFCKTFARERYTNLAEAGEGGEKPASTTAARKPGLAGLAPQPRAPIPGLAVQPGMMQPGMVQPGMVQPGMQPGMVVPQPGAAPPPRRPETES